MERFYKLPDLPFRGDELEPVISQKQIQIHHDKHHQAYVDKANELLKKIDESRGSNLLDSAGVYKKLTFNVAGCLLHSLFWENLSNPNNQGNPDELVLNLLENEYASLESFKERFSELAVNIEGSGWAILFYDPITGRPLLAPVQNHNLNIYPTFPVLLVLDMWEHAYYLDYQNDKKRYVERFWEVVNWQSVNERLASLK